MNMKDYSRNPMTIAFFEDESLEVEERIGYALKEGAKSFKISL